MQTLTGLRLEPSRLGAVVKSSLTDLLGEVPAIVILSYTGDASDGDIEGFVHRMKELLGSSTPITLGNIASSATKRAMEQYDR